jgi:uncharacterized protein (TIGR02145 family)
MFNKFFFHSALYLCVAFFICGASLHDNSEGEFESITIGKQTWMTKNWKASMPKSWFYDNDSVKNSDYGRLYFWSNAMETAPKGWHLPSLDEWKELINYCGGDSLGQQSLQLQGSSAFHLMFGGHKSANITTNDLFDLKEQFGYYWTSTSKGDQTAYAIEFRKGVSYIVENHYRKANGFSVRFIKNNP